VVFNQGEYIFKLGDDAQAMYIISEGVVKIEIAGKNDIQLSAG
jgi:CRP-like cAMP-binding protein